MNERYQIVEAKLSHMRALAARLRAGDLEECAAAGIAPRHLLFRVWRTSIIRRAVLVEGEIAAAWGLNGSSLLSSVGSVWLMTAPAIERIPVAFVREARREVRAMLETRSVLRTRVLSTYGSAVRFLELVGFHVKHCEAGERFRVAILER